MRAPTLALVLCTLAACGGDDDGAAIDATPGDTGATDAAVDAAIDGATDAAIDAAPTTLTVTSPVLVDGGAFPRMYTCRGVDVSPPLTWTGGPVAQGYAVTLVDLTNGLLHAAIWDIPGNVTSLPENVMKVYAPPVPAGAKQPLAYDGTTRGYRGPCPQTAHMYRFTVYAVDAGPLPGLSMTSTRAEVQAAILAHDLASATLTATFTP